MVSLSLRQLLAGLIERPREQVLDREHARALEQVGPVEPRPLHFNDPEDVPPLAVGQAAAQPVPTEFLQKDVLRRMNVQVPAVTEIDATSARDLARVERRAARHEEIDLQLCGLVDDVHARQELDGASKRVGVCVEFGRQPGNQRIDLRRVDGDDDIDVHSRARFAGEGTGDGPANGVRDAERLKM